VRLPIELLVELLVREDMAAMAENGLWDLYGGGDIENVSVLRSGSKGELDWRRATRLDVHRRCEGMQRRRNDIENRVSGYRLSHGHLEGLDGGEWRD
jgi:hypothetical protein